MGIQDFANIAALLGVLVTLIIFIIQNRALIRVQRAEYIYRLEDKYDQICLLRLQNPALLKYSRNWEDKDYESMSDAERSYFHYGELILRFVEVATYMNKVDKAIPDKVFRTFITPMICMELSYNAKLIETMVNKAGLSRLTQELIQDHLRTMDSIRIAKEKNSKVIIDAKPPNDSFNATP